jgi:hypothetical protein
MEKAEHRVEQALSDLATGLKTEQARLPRWVASVVAIAEDHTSAKVKLCTGGLIDVPISILRKVTHLGTVTSWDECLGIASAEIDVSTDVGVLIQQMALEIYRLSRSFEAARGGLQRLQGTDINNVSAPFEKTPVARPKSDVAPSDTVLPQEFPKIQFNGIAGDPYRPYFVFYAAPAHQYINEWEVISLQNCFFRSPPIIGGIDFDGKTLGLQFFPEAAHGTPVGSPYTATITLQVVLVQRTT